MKEDYTQYRDTQSVDLDVISKLLLANSADDKTEPASNRTITGADIRAALLEAVASGVIQGVNGIECDPDAMVDDIYRKHFGKA